MQLKLLVRKLEMTATTKTMHIISGKYKGRKLQSPENTATHPMGSREKLALMNLLQPYLTGATVLDAYAGSGALGLEALSRGAKEAVFVESNGKVAKTLNNNLDSVLGNNFTFATIYAYSIREFVKLSTYRSYFNIIIADPPYDHFDTSEINELTECLSEQGLMALSYPAKQGAPVLEGLELVSNRQYAAAGIAIYQKS